MYRLVGENPEFGRLAHRMRMPARGDQRLGGDAAIVQTVAAAKNIAVIETWNAKIPRRYVDRRGIVFTPS